MPTFKMPSLGADMEAGTLVEWLVREGDTVHRGDPMAVVDTDKSAIEVESFEEGVVQSFLVEPGTRVAVGTPLAELAPIAGVRVLGAAAVAEPAAREVPAPRETSREPASRRPALAVAEATVPAATAAHGPSVPAGADVRRPLPVPAPPSGRGRRISPYARKLAHELGVDLATVQGSGEHGLVRADDVRRAAHAVTAPSGTSPGVPTPGAEPPAPPSSTGVPLRGSRATIAALMTRAKREIPHYYVSTTVDLHRLMEWLRASNKERPVNERIVPAAAVLKATALAARRHPELNGFWTEEGFEPAADVHLGVAVSVREGALVAPAIHRTADLTLPEVMAALRDLVTRARAGRLRRAEVADPTLTVTDLGDQGVEEVIGVIYPPQVALLGVGRLTERPVAVDGMVGVRPTMRLTLSGDHRATDGATGARFLNTIDRLLQHPEEL